jgi:AcrR family transcriptional regulator
LTKIGKIFKFLHHLIEHFGAYSFHGTATRMIAQEVGIDISTLHYHWGERGGYIKTVQETMKVALIPAFVKREGEGL